MYQQNLIKCCGKVPRGGALTCQRYMGMCRIDDLPFQAPPSLQRPTFLYLVSVLMPSVSNKFCIFRPISLRFCQNFGSKHTFGKNSFPRPFFFNKIISDPTLKTRAAHTHQKNESAPPGKVIPLPLFRAFPDIRILWIWDEHDGGEGGGLNIQLKDYTNVTATLFLFFFSFFRTHGIREGNEIIIMEARGGYLVERWVRGCAAQIGCFFGLSGFAMAPFLFENWFWYRSRFCKMHNFRWIFPLVYL